MGGTTAIHGIRYPVGGDPMHFATDWFNTASDVDGMLPVVASATPPPKPGLVWRNSSTGVVQISDGSSWYPVSPPPYFGIGTTIAGTTPTVNTIPTIQAGYIAATTNGSAIGAFNFPATFPNGIQSVVLTPITGHTVHLVAAGVSTSVCQFVAAVQSTGAAAASVSVSVAYIAVGW